MTFRLPDADRRHIFAAVAATGGAEGTGRFGPGRRDADSGGSYEGEVRRDRVQCRCDHAVRSVGRGTAVRKNTTRHDMRAGGLVGRRRARRDGGGGRGLAGGRRGGDHADGGIVERQPQHQLRHLRDGQSAGGHGVGHRDPVGRWRRRRWHQFRLRGERRCRRRDQQHHGRPDAHDRHRLREGRLRRQPGQQRRDRHDRQRRQRGCRVRRGRNRGRRELVGVGGRRVVRRRGRRRVRSLSRQWDLHHRGRRGRRRWRWRGALGLHRVDRTRERWRRREQWEFVGRIRRRRDQR